MMADEKTFTQADIDTAIAEQAAKFAKETEGLKSKVDELLTESKTAKAKAKEEAEAAAKATEEAARKSGDVAAIEKSWQEKYDRDVASAKAEADALRGTVSTLTAGNAAKTIAAELALKGSEKILESLIAPRLRSEMTPEGPKIVVLDAAGKPSAATLDDLRKEITGDAAFKPILAGTNGNGAGGVNGGNGNGGAGTTGNMGGTKAERQAAIRAKYPDLAQG